MALISSTDNMIPLDIIGHPVVLKSTLSLVKHDVTSKRGVILYKIVIQITISEEQSPVSYWARKISAML